MRVAEIVYSRTGQVVDFFPPESIRDVIGIPSSVTATVYFGQDSNDDTAEFSPSVSVDSLNLTLGGTSGRGQTQPNLLTFSDTTGAVVGVPYLLDNNSSQREVVEAKKITATQIELLHDLQYDYNSSVSSLKGIRCYFTVDPTWVATESNILDPSEPSYRIRWQYTVGGTVYNHQTYMRLVRKPFKSTLTYMDVVGRWPDLLNNQPRDNRGDKFAKMIAAAENTVRTDILAEGYRPEQINDTEILDRLVNLALDYQIARFHAVPLGRDQEAFILETKNDYSSTLTKTLSTLKVDLDTGTEGASTYEPVSAYFFKR